MSVPSIDALAAAVDALAAAGVEDPRLDAELLLAEASGRDRAALVADREAALDPAAGRRFGELVRRRLRREPVAYILGRKGFRNLELEVDRRVLVPRPETELLVEVALERRPARVLDVGTGSGAIALAVADELPGCDVTATDTSPAALEVARANAERLGLADRVRFVEGTLPDGRDRRRGGGAGVDPSGGPEFDLVLANLPYIPEPDWPTLQPEVRDWEPREALLAGPDGLDAYRALSSTLGGSHLAPRASEMTATRRVGAVAVEVGEGQAVAVAGLFRDAGFGTVEARRDLAGIERVVVGEGAGPREAAER
ncbi:MAG TPA: peptide chain release factor N(5)-glutamine methyltransferase [Solirubrobacterales bacterium]|jgi:release factor glutamine methyltransferase|nr:peptide chain release factor N(5)-glutamine methyltransferase [Solirubrobacterales bacterium]